MEKELDLVISMENMKVENEKTQRTAESLNEVGGDVSLVCIECGGMMSRKKINGIPCRECKDCGAMQPF